MDERKRIGRGKSERKALVEQLWERSEEGRKETNRKPSTGTGKESMRDQAGQNGDNVRSESGKEGKHQWNSCGSETGKDERKQTGSRVQEPGSKA